MKTEPLLFASGLLALVAGCATAPLKVSHVNADFTIAYVKTSEVGVPPNPEEEAAPGFSTKLLDDTADGYAIVRFISDTSGNLHEVQCVEASNAVFARAAEKIIAQGTFMAARKGGKAVAVKIEEAFVFHLKAASPAPDSPWPMSRYDDQLSAAMTNRYDDNGIFVSNYQHQ